MISDSAERKTVPIRFQRTEKLLKSALSSKTFTTISLLIFCTLMLVSPSYFLESARRGLSLFSTVVLPSLFPFYFCAILLTKIGAAKALSTMFQRPFFKLYHTPKESAYIMFLSMISGYPIGAACIKELLFSGIISTRDAKAISAFASTSGPIFILGTVGSAIFNNIAAGVIILISHYIAAFLNGFLYRNKTASNDTRAVCLAGDADSALSASMERATLSMLLVGGYIVISGMIIDALRLIKADALIYSAFGNAGQPIVAILFGSIEMTRGAIECAKCSSPILAISLAAAVVSLGGFSVTLQTYNFLSACGMKLGEVIIRKLTHSVIAFLIALALSAIFV